MTKQCPICNHIAVANDVDNGIGLQQNGPYMCYLDDGGCGWIESGPLWEVSHTVEMEQFFVRRTRAHISLVQKYADRLESNHSDMTGLIGLATQHDRSKFAHPERIPYIHLTWQHKCRAEGVLYQLPRGINIPEATFHHITHNTHHPESFSKAVCMSDSKVPANVVIVDPMPLLAMGELVADLCAMSEELGGNPLEFFDSRIGTRWDFTAPNQDYIRTAIKIAWPN
jgi:hypothetical protein